MTTSLVAAPPPLSGVQAQQSQEQVVQDEDNIDEKYRHQDSSDKSRTKSSWFCFPGEVCDPATYGQGGAKGVETDEVLFPVEASPNEIVGENVEKAAPESKGPPLDVIPSACVPAAVKYS